MAATTNKGPFQPDSEVHITFEDQQKINQFAKHNAKFEELKDQLKIKKAALQNLEDAFEELELMDESEKIPVAIGGMFFYQSFKETQDLLEQSKKKIMQEVSKIEKKNEELTNAMSCLKTMLYAKFGSHINLEHDDE